MIFKTNNTPNSQLLMGIVVIRIKYAMAKKEI